MGRTSLLPRAFLAFLVEATAFAVGVPSFADAQVIEGRLLDDATAAPIPRAAVTLLDRAENRVRGVTTDDEGAFSLAAPFPGRYRLRASRIGYGEETSSPVDVREGELVEVEFRLSTEPLPVAPLTVLSDRPALVLHPRLERQGFYERQELYGTKSGFGRFLGPDDIERRVLFDVYQLFQDMPGMRVSGAGGRLMIVTGRRGCRPTYYVDGMRLPSDMTPDELIRPVDLVAAEIYPGMVAPARFPGSGRCAVVVLWTGVP